MTSLIIQLYPIENPLTVFRAGASAFVMNSIDAGLYRRRLKATFSRARAASSASSTKIDRARCDAAELLVRLCDGGIGGIAARGGAGR